MEISFKDNKLVIGIGTSAILLGLFISYGTLEVFRIAYVRGVESLHLSLVLLFFGCLIIVGFRKHLNGSTVTASAGGHMFSSKAAKVVMAIHAESVALILSYLILALQADSLSFLIVQLMLLACFWLDDRKLSMSINMLRVSFMFTAIYVGYMVLLTKNTFVGFVTLVYFVSWLYLQKKIE